MSHIDARTEFSAAQAVTVDAISTNVIARDGLGLSPNSTQNLGSPGTARLLITCAETPSAADTITITLESAENEALSTNAVVHWSSGALDTDNFVAGDVLAAVPLPFAEYKDYIGVRYNVGTGPLTAGKFNAAIVLDARQWRVFDNGKPEHPTGT